MGWFPIWVDGVLVDPMGRPWRAPYSSAKPGGIANHVRVKQVQKLDPEEARRRTQKSQVYWAAYRTAQKEKTELMGYTPPGWLGRKREPKRRQWLPGEHRKASIKAQPKKSTTAKGTNTSGQGNLF